MLADSGIKWKVDRDLGLFLRGFIEPLKDDNTLIITARRRVSLLLRLRLRERLHLVQRRSTMSAARHVFVVEAFEAAKEAVG